MSNSITPSTPLPTHPSHKGMTLLEVVCTLVLASLFFGVFFSFIVVSTAAYQKQARSHDVWLEGQSMSYFIQEEIDLAEKVCVYVHEGNYVEGNGGVPICHKASSSLVEGDTYLVSRIVWDEGKVDGSGKDLSKVMWVKKDKKSEACMFEITYQGQTLIEGVEGMTAKQVGDTTLLAVKLVSGDTISWTLFEDEKKKVNHGALHTY